MANKKESQQQGTAKAKERKSWIELAVLGIMLVVLDQFTKWLSLNYLAEKPINLGILQLTSTINTGSSFSLFTGMNTILMWFAIAALIALLYWRKEFTGTSIQKIFYIVILAGITGNLIDRIFIGGVIDFIDFGWFPVFNVADSCLTIGVAGFVISEFSEIFYKKSRKSKVSN